MSRAERRMYKRARGQAALRRLLLFLTAVVILAGLASHLPGQDGFSVQPMGEPTATPVAAAFDETVTTREVELPAETWYAIQIGVYSTQEAAASRADLYADRGAPGYVTEEAGKWRVFIACYNSENDAASVRERLTTMQKVDTYLHHWSSPAVTLRLTGMAGQLDVAEAGLTLPNQTATLLRNGAADLDAGEMTAEEARAVVAAADERIQLWAKTARERFAMPYPQLIGEVLDFADAWQARSKAVAQAEDVTALSAQMKLQAMAVYDDAIAMRSALMK